MNNEQEKDKSGAGREIEKRTSIRETNVMESNGSISPLDFITIVFKHRLIFIWSVFIVFSLVIGYTFLKQLSYTATASFLPETSDRDRSLSSGVVAQFGITLPIGSAGQSPAFYIALIKSREILIPLIESVYDFTHNGESFRGNFLEIMEITASTDAMGRQLGMEAISGAISATADRESGLVEFSVTTPWAPFSEQMATCIIELLNEFNLDTRRSNAKAEKEFLESRLVEVHRELQDAEDSLQEFLENNRQFEWAPRLEFIHDRLQWNVRMRQDVVTSLVQVHEQARINEARDTPIITIVEEPDIPVRHDPRKLKLKAVVSVLLGLILGGIIAFLKEALTRNRSANPSGYKEFELVLSETIRDMRNPLRMIKRIN